ncbi:MAG: hypothetical protein KGN02_00985 [bacterium]|nr:hypothetical protein [bacterium]
MRRWIAAAMFLAMTGLAHAATIINPKLIPDGTYVVHVRAVVDAKNIVVKLDNGLDTSLTTDREAILFDKLTAGETVKVSIVHGVVVMLGKPK